QNFVDDLDGGFVGNALALEKSCREPGSLERAGDRLASAVHHDRVDADCFQKHDLARDPMTFRLFRRIHEAASVLQDEKFTAKTLNVGQRLKKSSRFGNDFLH